MANTYTQIHLQFVFAPKYRASLISLEWEVDLFKYITGIVRENKSKMLSINAVPDHLHMLVGFHTNMSISDFMRDVKAGSSDWINKRNLTRSRFEWQSGYGGFSYSKSQIPNVIAYIEAQKEHHRETSFLEEYKSILSEFEIEFKDEYLFNLPI